MQLDDDRLYLLLDRYLAGEASAAETQSIRDWLAEDPAHALVLEDLRQIRHVTAEPVPPTSVDAAWANALRVERPRLSRRRIVAVLATAAALAAVAGGWAMLSRPPAWREVSTPVAHRAVVHLRDGTRVTLAPRSRLRYTADYASTHRDVYLDGEAYFQVTNDTRRPFRVHTARSVTEDLGTAFVIRAYADQNATEVVVAEGRVALWRLDTTTAARATRPDARPGLVLEARDLGRLDANGDVTFRRGIDVARRLAWTNGVLAFDGTPLRDVVLTLGRWYDVNIQLSSTDSALAARRLTATFDNEPIDLVLKRIGLTLGVRVERSAGTVLLLRNGR